MGERQIVEMLSPRECRSYLATAGVGRVAVTVGALPAIHTVSFLLHQGRLLFRMAQRSPLRHAVAGSVVAFSADNFGEGRQEGWSVLVRGVGEEVTDELAAERMRALPLRSHSDAPDRDCFLCLPLTQVSGSRVHWPLAVEGASASSPYGLASRAS
jgi:nitroimidazol reductase NimA-like FMN-containing flavoprotein (pyridoxamine 5'-phosphate oxidase superfamily)